MRTSRDSKAMAKSLRDALKARSIPITHSESLELIAKAFGLADWNTLAAKIAAQRPAGEAEPLAEPPRPALATAMVRPFIPGGKDYEASKRFYEALGFTMTFDAGTVSGWSCDSGWFLLQNHYDKAWAETFMMQLGVDDVEAWWAHIQSLDLAARFGVPEPKAPALQSWGQTVAYLTGPCGELWHITQA